MDKETILEINLSNDKSDTAKTTKLFSRILPLTDYVIFTGRIEETNRWVYLYYEFKSRNNKKVVVNYKVTAYVQGNEKQKLYEKIHSDIEISPNGVSSLFDCISGDSYWKYCKMTIRFEEFFPQEASATASDLQKNLMSLYKDDFTKDIKFVVEGESVMAHGLIVGARNKVIRKIVDRDLAKVNNKVIEISDVKMPAFKSFLKYLYTGEVENICELADELLVLAGKYDVRCLKTKCGQYFRRGINKDNIICYLMKANIHDCQTLKTAALFNMKLYIRDLHQTEEFQQLVSDSSLLQEVTVAITVNDFYEKYWDEERSSLGDNNSVQQDFIELFDDDWSKDIKFVIGNESIMAHKLIVCSRNQVLKTMLESDMKEGKDGVVVIEDVRMSVFKCFLKYLYTEDIENLEEFAEDLLMLGDKYDMKCLKNKCEEYLCQAVNKENIVRCLIKANLVNCGNLKYAAMSRLPIFIKDIWKTDEFQMIKLYPGLSQEIFDLMFSNFVEFYKNDIYL